MLHTLILVAAIGQSGDAPKVTVPTELHTKPGVMIEINAQTNGKIVRWVRLSDDCGIIPFPDGKTAIFSAPKEGVFKVLAYTAIGDVPSAPAICIVTVGESGPKPPVPPGPDPPKPPPTPPGPEPTTPLGKKLKEAFGKDGSDPAKKRQWAKDIAGFFSAMRDHVKNKNAEGEFGVQTIGDLLSDYRKAIPAVLPKEALTAVREVCADEVFALAGDDADKRISNELRVSLAELFEKISKELEKMQ